MPYVGWKILAYRYYHNRPLLQPRVAKTDLVKAVRESFQTSDWSIFDEEGQMMLTHLPTQKSKWKCMDGTL